MSPNLPGSPNQLQSATNIFGGPGVPNAHAIGALVSQHRLLELSRFGLRGYDLAQHMLTQQGAVSKLLGEYKFKSSQNSIGNHKKKIGNHKSVCLTSPTN